MYSCYSRPPATLINEINDKINSGQLEKPRKEKKLSTFYNKDDLNIKVRKKRKRKKQRMEEGEKEIFIAGEICLMKYFATITKKLSILFSYLRK